ncbi:MAG: DUF2807 domain-containing protein [Chloroflexi bacterium]|nr:DUF2807 domain-containing protein [Chloroflexota bacterium]MDA1145580.1 DUF2807 domain-containing protein [Chloroflexota bacterium]
MRLNRPRTFLIPWLIAAAVVVTGCVSVEIDGDAWNPSERGSGHLVTEQRVVSTFQSVRVSDGLRVEIDRGPATVEVTLDGNLIGRLTTAVIGGQLMISCDDCAPTADSLVRLTTPNLDRLVASGGSRIVAADLEGDRLSLELNGGSYLEIGGSINELTIDGSGGSEIDAVTLVVTRLHIDLSGGSRALIEVIERVDGDLSGGSHLELTGTASPATVVDVSGGSSVDR